MAKNADLSKCKFYQASKIAQMTLKITHGMSTGAPKIENFVR